MRRKAVRVRLPEYWGLTYEAQSGNEYAERRLGRRYQTDPVVSRSNRFYNPDLYGSNYSVSKPGKNGKLRCLNEY